MVSQESEVSNHWKYAFEDDIMLGQLVLGEYEASIGQNKLPAYQFLAVAGRIFYRAKERLENESPWDFERAEYQIAKETFEKGFLSDSGKAMELRKLEDGIIKAVDIFGECSLD